MSLLEDPAATDPGRHDQEAASDVSPDEPIVLTRRGIDKVLIGFGVLATLVFVVAGALLLWGANFADDYVHDELTAQRITFPPEEALVEEGRDDLVKYADQSLDTGKEAEAYASFIDGHLANTGAQYAEPGAEPLTYAELGGPERAARAAVAEATEGGASEAEIAELQAQADQISADRNTLFKGETLRGLLLSAYAWSTVGRIAGYAAIAAFVAAALMAILVVMGVVHYRRMTHPTA
jgi:hypothetical protein